MVMLLLSTARPRVAIDLILGELGGIAIDTNIYRKHGFRFSEAPLATLANMRTHGIRVLVPEIWRRELLRHAAAWVDADLVAFRGLARRTEWFSERQAVVTAAMQAAFADESAEAVAERVMSTYFKLVSAVQLVTSWAESGASVLDAYFCGRAPFEVSGAKKHEFPDALALATLATWATREGKSVVVVTGDKGCIDACSAYPGLIVFPSLLEALEALQAANRTQLDSTRSMEASLRRELSSERSELRQSIESSLEAQASSVRVTVSIDYRRPFELDYAVEDIRLVGLRVPPHEGEPEIRVLNLTAQTLTFSWDMRVDLEIDVQATLLPHGTRQRIGPNEVTSRSTVFMKAVVSLLVDPLKAGTSLSEATVRSIQFERQELDLELDDADVELWVSAYD